MRFDLIDLRLFLHTIEAGSITHGAKRSNIALASASARLRGMEEALGVALLERSRRGVQPRRLRGGHCCTMPVWCCSSWSGCGVSSAPMRAG